MDADVVVIGAGAAGLTAASRLARHSLRVVVLEARDRVGGRVLWTDGSDGRESVELGAEFIHGRAPETMALLRRAGVTAVELEGESFTRGRDGALVRDETDFRESTDIFVGAYDLRADESVEAYLRRFDGDPTVARKVELARLFVEGFDAADPAIASVLGIADELRSGVDYATHRPSRGYRPLFDLLYEECVGAGVRVELSTIVGSVTWRRGEVSVEAVAGSIARAFRAKAVVVTLPVGVLRGGGVRFDPALPGEKQEALDKIEMGHVVKVALRFRSRFWAAIDDGRYRDASFFRMPGGTFPAYWTQGPLPGSSVVGWAGGTHAEALLEVPAPTLTTRALDEFTGLFRESHVAREEFIDGVMHDWWSDPFARGAYSYVAVGGSGSRATLGTPVEDTLFFAGEATSTDGQGGTVNGAIATGERAAIEAASALGSR